MEIRHRDMSWDVLSGTIADIFTMVITVVGFSVLIGVLLLAANHAKVKSKTLILPPGWKMTTEDIEGDSSWIRATAKKGDLVVYGKPFPTTSAAIEDCIDEVLEVERIVK